MASGWVDNAAPDEVLIATTLAHMGLEGKTDCYGLLTSGCGRTHVVTCTAVHRECIGGVELIGGVVGLHARILPAPLPPCLFPLPAPQPLACLLTPFLSYSV